MHIVIFTGGEMHASALVTKALASAEYIIAADSGAMHALSLGITPDVVIGDFDSLDSMTQKKLQEEKVTFLPYPKEKDETDTQLAVTVALEKGATCITMLGGISGNRFDHILANVLLSFTTQVPITFIDGKQKIWGEKGPAQSNIQGNVGDLLSLIPLYGDVEEITTENLQYPLKNETLIFGKPRGVSNVFMKNEMSVKWKKGSLVMIWTKKEN